MFGKCNWHFSNYEETYKALHKKRVELKQKDGGKSQSFREYTCCWWSIFVLLWEIPKAFAEFQKHIPVEVYTILLQKIGDNIRASGDAFSENVVPENVLKLSQRVNMINKNFETRNIQERNRC